MAAMGLLHKLKQASDGEKSATWKEFFFNCSQVKMLDAVVNPETSAQILRAGMAYGGAGWTTAKAAHTVFTLSGLAVHSSDLGSIASCGS